MEVMEALNVKFLPGVTETNLSISLKQYRPSNLKAYEAYLKGFNLFFRRTKADSIAARKLFEEAVALDPNFTQAYRSLGFAYLDEVWFGITKTPQKSIEQAEKVAQKSMELSPDQPPPHGLLSMISLLKKDYDDAVAHAEKAVDLSPNDPGSYFSLGFALRFADRFEEAIKAHETSFRLSPLRPLTWVNGLAWSYAGNKQYDKAISLFHEIIQRSPDDFFAFQGLTVSYELSGNHEKALWAAENMMRANPSFSIAAAEKMGIMKDGDFRKRIFEAYRRAGIK